MKRTISILAVVFSFFCVGILAAQAQGAVTAEVEKFTQEYLQEKKTEVEKIKQQWELFTAVGAGNASYEESEETLTSDYKVVFPRFSCLLTNQVNNSIERAIGFSYGQSQKDTETWYISSLKYQTNDLLFEVLSANCHIGKILYSDKYKNLQVVPFLGYGYRYINFERSNFNILNLIILREVVKEKYYLHHTDLGLRFTNKFGEKWALSGKGAFGYVFLNEAKNSSLGTVDGGGGYLIDGNLNLSYSLSARWQFLLGGSAELQSLKGGSKEDVIWPDNDLRIYGADIGMRFIF